MDGLKVRNLNSQRIVTTLLAGLVAAGGGAQAFAQDYGGPTEIGEGVTFDPIVNARLRYEAVNQDNAAGDADAVTMRLRMGGEVKADGFSLLVEGEGTLALADDFNDTLPGNGVEPFSVIADPDNIELNRLQLAYKKDGSGLTVGRQRIILDDARFVGNVGWRQNEQTFDAVRGQAGLGPVSLDATYAISQRTIFGVDSPNEHFDGDLVLLGAGIDAKRLKVKAFAYLVDYDSRIAFSSQTYGIRANVSIPAGENVKVNAVASYATQSDYGLNPSDYRASFWNAELGASLGNYTLKGGVEVLGSDNGAASFQTPLATLHKFNGWADQFLTTPAGGIEDLYVGFSAKLPSVKLLPGLKAGVTYHKFNSDFGSQNYGDEFDASLGFKVGPVGLLLKYANYNSDSFGVDTEKLWFQAGYSF